METRYHDPIAEAINLDEAAAKAGAIPARLPESLQILQIAA